MEYKELSRPNRILQLLFNLIKNYFLKIFNTIQKNAQKHVYTLCVPENKIMMYISNKYKILCLTIEINKLYFNLCDFSYKFLLNSL